MSENYNMELIADIEESIKQYNKKPDKDVKKRDIVTLLQKAAVLVPGKVNTKTTSVTSEVLEGIDFQFDVVKDDGRARLVPVFTSFEQIPQDYLDTFSFIRINCGRVYKFIEDCDNLRGMVVNPFTEYNFEIKKKQMSKKARTRGVSKAVEGSQEAIIVYDNKKYPIKKTPFTIGREGTNIEIPESYISKIHVVISYKDGKYRIADYDSTNGTKLNGTALRSKVYYEVRDGYEIELSDKEKLHVYIN
ncbi:MAG: SseB family protein [Eubacterium sp.]|nr:SseB family protein [Eubacterium sp.]